MLRYERIHEVAKARRRLAPGRRDRYAWRQDGCNRENDQLTLFTFETAALADSEHNLDFLLATALAHDQQYVVLTDTKIQIVGNGSVDRVANPMAPVEWRQDFGEWLDERCLTTPVPAVEHTTRGGVVTLQTWRHCFCLKEHQGVYEVATGRRMTNREQIGRAFWDLGFATWRGRPYSIARLQWNGEREELEELTALAGRYWRSVSRTDVAKKIVSAHRSINRYAAWPGSW